MRLVDAGETAENRIEAQLYNSYSLGSRMQFRVNVGADHLLVEQLRAGGPTPELDRKVTVGWDSRDAIFVGA